jgi:hypothetical protein
MSSQAGIGSGYNFVSEFSLDILHAFGLKKGVRACAKTMRTPSIKNGAAPRANGD